MSWTGAPEVERLAPVTPYMRRYILRNQTVVQCRFSRNPEPFRILYSETGRLALANTLRIKQIMKLFNSMKYKSLQINENQCGSREIPDRQSPEI